MEYKQMDKKFFSVRFLVCVAAILSSSSAAAQTVVEHKGVFKEFQWPTKISIDHFVTFTGAAPLGLNIFQIPDNIQGMQLRWPDNVTVKVVRKSDHWQVENVNAGVWSQKIQLPPGNLDVALDGRGVVFRSADQKYYRIRGGLNPHNITLLLPQGVKVPQIKSVYVIDDILLYLSADEAEKVLNSSLKLFASQKKEIEKSSIYLSNRYTWQTNIRLNVKNLAKVKAEASAALEGFLPALLADPLVRDRCNWLFYMAMRQYALPGGYFGGRFNQIWSTKLPGRGEIINAMYFAEMLKNLVAHYRRTAFVSSKEGYNYQNMLSGGLCSALEYVPKQSGLPVGLQKKASLRCARGEAESLQLVLSAAGKDINDVSVEAVAQTPHAPALEVDRIEFIHLSSAGSVQIPLNRGGDVPEPDVCIPIKKNEKFSVGKYTNLPFLLTVQTLNSTLPGTYKYTVNVKVNGKKAFNLPITVKVEEFALQDRIPCLSGLRPEQMSAFYKDKKLEKVARMNLMKALLKHRMEPLNLYRPSPLDEDMAWAFKNGVQAVLLDGKLEKLADPRAEMPQYIELYGSVDGVKFERIPAKAKLDKRNKKDPISACDIVVDVKGDTRKYKYCKLHYSQPTDMHLKGHIYYFEAMCKGKKTMLVNGTTMLKEMRFIQPDKNKSATWAQAKKAGLVKYDLLNRELYGASIFWENKVGEIKSLRLYDHLRDKQLALLKPFYNKVRALGGKDIPVYLYGFDERERNYNMPMLSAMKNARLAFENVKFVTTATNPEADPELFKYLDVHCRSIGKSDIQLNMQTAKTYGTDYWYYIGGGPYYPFGNFERVDQDRINSRGFFWGMIAYDHLKGWLYWAINYWSGNEHFVKQDKFDWSLWQTNHGSFNGMRALFYPGKNGEIYPSLRASAMRDGLEDVELFRIAQTLVKNDADRKELEVIRQGYASGLSSFCNDIKLLEKNRNRLYDLLAKLVKPPRITRLNFKNFNHHKTNLFHPSVTVLKDGRFMATMQEVNNSDNYGEPMYSISSDKGKTWSKLQYIDSLKYIKMENSEFTQAVADVRPFTLQDGSVAVFGCSTYYIGNIRAGCLPEKQPIIPAQAAYYSIWSPETEQWAARKKLDLPGIKHYRSACTQIATVGKDQVIVPIYLDAELSQKDVGTPKRYGVMTALYKLVDGKLQFIRRSRLMTIPCKRGLIEPSIISLPEGGFALTIRAEDERMYCAVSKDGIDWSDPIPWRWNNTGKTVKTQSTQQHWLTLGKKVYLVYTRFDGSNADCTRYRTPLYIAQADPAKAMLFMETEAVLFPRSKINGVEGRYGNFHCTQIDTNSALVSDAALHSVNMGRGVHRNIITTVNAAEVRGNVLNKQQYILKFP